MSVPQSDLKDPALLAEVDLARAAAQAEAGEEQVGDHVDVHIEDEAAVTHLFEADKTGYRGWRWAVTVTSAGPDTDVTISEVVLLPGPDALVAPEWVPWEHRVRAGDLGVGDLLPTAPDDSRLVPAYLESDDPAVEEVAREAGLGRSRVLSRPGRLEAATRWQHGEFGPRSDMARSAPGRCGTCGFYLPLAGTLRAAFGTCGNEISPADGHVVHVEYGCGAHSEAEVEQVSPVLVADLIYDDATLDVESLDTPTAPPAESVEPAAAATPEPPIESAEPVAEPAPEPEASTEPEPVEPTAPATDSAEPVAEPELAADPASPTEPVVEPAEPTDSAPIAEPELAVEPEAVAEPEAAAEPEPAAKAEPTAESVAASKDFTAPEAIAGPAAKPPAPAEIEPVVASETDPPPAG